MSQPACALATAARMLVGTGVAIVLASVPGVAAAGLAAPGSAAGDVFLGAFVLELPPGWSAEREAELLAGFAARFPGARPDLDAGRTLSFYEPRDADVREQFAWLGARDVPTTHFQTGPGWPRSRCCRPAEGGRRAAPRRPGRTRQPSRLSPPAGGRARPAAPPRSRGRSAP